MGKLRAFTAKDYITELNYRELLRSTQRSEEDYLGNLTDEELNECMTQETRSGVSKLLQEEWNTRQDVERWVERLEISS